MSRLVSLAQELVGLEEKVRPIVQRMDELKAEIVKEVSGNTAAPVAAPQAAVAPVVESKSAPKEDKGSKRRFPSMKRVVQDILSKNTEGLDLMGLTREVQSMIDRGEYESKAEKLATVISQATTQLKAEKVLDHDRETRKYKLAAPAA